MAKDKQQINPILVKIQTEIEAKVSPENKKAFEKANIAVEQIMFSPKTHANMQLVKRPEMARKDIVGTVSKGVSGLMWLLYVQSKKTMKPEILVMSGIIAITKALDFAERGLGIPITPEQIAKTTKICMETLFEKMGVTPDKLAEVIANGRKEIEDYQKHQTFLDGKMQALKPKIS